MAFKEDRSFLDKITMGAVGTKKVIEKLNDSGHQIIELERYCTNNKIWSTKIKRLRIPDLLCLNCGKRIESRAKSKLGIIMSDADKNPDRRWFAGLRPEDLVAFIQCSKSRDQQWDSKGIINLFSVQEMLNTEALTRLSAPKSVNEGAERDRTWKSYVPSYDFIVETIEIEEDGYRVRMKESNGRRHSQKIKQGQYIYVRKDEAFPSGAKIVSSVICREEDHHCPGNDYDFTVDLDSNIKETVYIAVKALGYLKRHEAIVKKLINIARQISTDKRIALEAYSSLIRLGENIWDEFERYALNSIEREIKMEYVLILGELNHYKEVANLLSRIFNDNNFDEELRAAAIWSMRNDLCSLRIVIDYCYNENLIIRNHAIAKVEKNYLPELTNNIIDKMKEDITQCAISSRILSVCINAEDRMIVIEYTKSPNPLVRYWLLYTMGLGGRNRFERIIKELDPNSEDTFQKLELMWDYHTKYLCKDEVENIEFIKLQNC